MKHSVDRQRGKKDMIVKTDISYTHNPSQFQKLDIVIPKSMVKTEFGQRRENTKGQRVILFVHGGSWTFGSKERIQTHLKNLAKHTNSIVVAPNYQLTRLSKDEGFYVVIVIVSIVFIMYCAYIIHARKRGYVKNIFVLFTFLTILLVVYVFHNNISYHKYKHPAHINDVAQAFKWTHENIEEYGGDNKNMFVAGHSAGGHIASLLSTNPVYLHRTGLDPVPNKYIKGVISISGVYSDKRMQNDFLSKFVLSRIFGEYSNYTDAFPIYHTNAKTTPPFLLLNANQDGLLKRHTMDFYYTLKQNHVYVKYHLAKNKNHLNIHWFNPTNHDGDEENICDDANLLKTMNTFIEEVEELEGM